MMKFEGTVNGKKFDTVEAYNEELQRCIAEGINIDASSKTTSEGDKPEEISKEDLILFPGFDSSSHYIDDIVEGDDEDANRAAACLEYINQCSDDVVKNIDKFDLKECHSILDDIRDIQRMIDEDNNDNAQILEKLDETKTFALHAQGVIDMYKKFYSDMEKFFVKEIDKRGGKVDEAPKIQHPTRRNPIMDLIEAIFA